MRRFLPKALDEASRRLLGHISWASAGQGVAALSVLVETFLFTNALSLQGFGRLMLLIAASELVFGLLDCRSGEAVIKFLPEMEEGDDPNAPAALLRFILSVDGCIALIGIALTVLGFPLLTLWQPSLAPFFPLVLILIGGHALKAVVRSCGSYFRVTDQFAFSVKLGVLHVALRLIILTVVLQYNQALASLCWALFSADAIFFVLIGGAFVRSLRRREINLLRAKPLSAHQRKAVWNFFLYINLASTLLLIGRKVDVLVVGALAGPDVVALYKVAFRVAGLPLILSGTLLIAAYPEMSRLYSRGQRLVLRNLILKATAVMACVALASIIGFALIGKWALALVAGDAYVAAYGTVLVMLTGTLFGTTFFWAHPFLLLFNRNRYIAFSALTGLAVQFLLLALLVTNYGALGGGLAMTCGTLTIYGVYFLRIRRDWPQLSQPPLVSTAE